MSQRTMNSPEDRSVRKRVDPARDDEAVREKVVPLEHLKVAAVDLAQRRAGEPRRLDQLIADHVHRPHEVADRTPVLQTQARESKVLVLAAQEPRMPMLVKD